MYARSLGNDQASLLAAEQHRLSQPIFNVHVEGGDPVGPVSAVQIARGIRAGKVPAHASIQRTGDVFWSDLLDEPDVIAALKHV
jgi:hypothetical protein